MKLTDINTSSLAIHLKRNILAHERGRGRERGAEKRCVCVIGIILYILILLSPIVLSLPSFSAHSAKIEILSEFYLAKDIKKSSERKVFLFQVLSIFHWLLHTIKWGRKFNKVHGYDYKLVDYIRNRISLMPECPGDKESDVHISEHQINDAKKAGSKRLHQNIS